jgi:hypothetical protein
MGDSWEYSTLPATNCDEDSFLWVVMPWLHNDVSKDCSVTFFRVKGIQEVFILLGLFNPEDEGAMVL